MDVPGAGDTVFEKGVEPLEELELLLCIIAVVGDGPADDRVVFLFDEAVVVLTVRTGSSKGDPLVNAVPVELVVDELTAIVGVDPEQGKGELVADVLESGKNMALGLVFDDPWFSPASGHIGDGEGLSEVPEGYAAVVRYQVDLAEAGLLFVPVGKGPDGNVVLQKRSGAGCGTPL